MRRSEICWVDFEPAKYGEICKTRQAVIVSNDVANANLNRLQVVPLASNSGRFYPSEAKVSVAVQVSKVIADQPDRVAKERLSKQLGVLSKDDLRQVERVLKYSLACKFSTL